VYWQTETAVGQVWVKENVLRRLKPLWAYHFVV